MADQQDQPKEEPQEEKVEVLPGSSLVTMDYNANEVRVLADVTVDPAPALSDSMQAVLRAIILEKCRTLGISRSLIEGYIPPAPVYGTNLCREIMGADRTPLEWAGMAITDRGLDMMYHSMAIHARELKEEELQPSMKKEISKSRHVVNEEQVRDYCVALSEGYSSSVQDWASTTFRHWMVHQSTHTEKRVIDQLEMNTQSFKIAYAQSEWQFRNVAFCSLKELPEWARARYAEGQSLHVWERPSEHAHGVYTHWLDYLEQAAFKRANYRLSIEQLLKAVAAWDKRLAKQKLMQSLYLNVERMESPLLEEAGYELYLLTNAAARKTEGQYMGHCVGDSTYGTGSKRIFSVRSAKDRVSVYTVEVRQVPLPKEPGILVFRADKFETDPEKMVFKFGQMKGRFNNEISLGDKDLIKKALCAMDSRIKEVVDTYPRVRFIDTPHHPMDDFFMTQAVGRLTRAGVGLRTYTEHFIDRYEEIFRPGGRRVWDPLFVVDSMSMIANPSDRQMELKVLKQRSSLDNDAAVNGGLRYVLPEQLPDLKLKSTAKAVPPDTKARVATWSGNPFNQPKRSHHGK